MFARKKKQFTKSEFTESVSIISKASFKKHEYIN